jgi:hypothetical protein
MLMGWLPKVVPQTKLSDVLFNSVERKEVGKDENKKQELELKNLSKEGRHMTFQEFRTAVALTVPRLSTLSKEPLDSQAKKEPLDVKDLKLVKNFDIPRISREVDLVHQAYALKVSVSNPKSKTTLVHYENARNRLLHSTANQPIIDARGVRYNTFSDLPKDIQEYLRKKYRYPTKKRERDASDSGEEEDVDMEEGQRSPLPDTQPPSKRTRSSKGSNAKAKGPSKKTKK